MGDKTFAKFSVEVIKDEGNQRIKIRVIGTQNMLASGSNYHESILYQTLEKSFELKEQPIVSCDYCLEISDVNEFNDPKVLVTATVEKIIDSLWVR